MKSIASVDNQQEIQEVGGSDFGFAFEDIARFRVAIFKQKGNVGLVLRLIPNKILTFEQIGLPQSLKQVISQPRGLILVTGPTGSGKSTSLATMIDYLNTEFDYHIITIEDPIEYYHNHKKSLVNQREGVTCRRSRGDSPRAAHGPRHPGGEMRDLAIEAAVTAAETGHLVFGVHTTGAVRTIDRLVDAFPTNQQEQSARSQAPESGDFAGAAPAKWFRARGGVRGHDHYAGHSEPDSRQQVIPHHLVDSDRPQIRHESFG